MMRFLNIVIIVIVIFKFSSSVFADSANNRILECKITNSVSLSTKTELTNPNLVVEDYKLNNEKIDELNNRVKYNFIFSKCGQYTCDEVKFLKQFTTEDGKALSTEETYEKRFYDFQEGFDEHFLRINYTNTRGKTQKDNNQNPMSLGYHILVFKFNEQPIEALFIRSFLKPSEEYDSMNGLIKFTCKKT